MAAYIDEHRSRFRVGPICGVLSESLDCGFLTSRGYRMFRTRPVSRMRAGHEALARDILQIHSDFFMAVYGYGKMHAQLVAQGWDRAEVGRDQVMNIMRELGIRGVRRGKTPVTVFCQIFVGRFGVSFSPFERLFLGRFGFGQSCGLSVIA